MMNRAYKSAGVDVHAGYRAVELIKAHARTTLREEVLSDIGGFGGMFSLAALKGMEDPVMISGADGVGTKLKVAFLLDKHDTIGIDCVAMCVNDIVCCGAEPLFFLDYIACGKNRPEKIEQIVKGVATGCIMSGAALIGGETAEHPILLPPDEYDIAGFAVGVVDRKDIIDGKNIAEGDILLGLKSSGLHSNGFSLVRNVLRMTEENLMRYDDRLGATLGEVLLTPTRIYVKAILSLIKAVKVKGIANITGGGFFENVPRILPPGLMAEISVRSFEIPPIFDLICHSGGVSSHDMFNTFNMGIGMVVCVAPEDADTAVAILEKAGETVLRIGVVAKNPEGEAEAELCLE